MSDHYPTARQTDAGLLDPAADPDLPTELLNQPWIDIHNHAHTLSWSDREQYALTGCRAMIMVASGNHWTPYKPVRADDIRYLWDDALNRRRAIERNHFFEPSLALGMQTGIRVENPDDLLDPMDRYCDLDTVVAIGEIGIRPSQHGSAWPLEEQQAAIESQMSIAARHKLPVILHTPTPRTGAQGRYQPEFGIPGFERNTSLEADQVFESENPELDAVRYDVEAAQAAGLDEERIVASHADPNNLDYLMAETDCYVSFTLGRPWLTGVTPVTVADAVEEYGHERIMLDTDAANVLDSDVLALKRAILELYRLGIDTEAIEAMVYETPREIFGIAQ